jgi:ABC-2 type transport system permease protein
VNPPASLRRVRVTVAKEFLQLRRDPRLYRLLLVAPVIQLVVFGYAVSTDVRHTATFVVDRDHTAASRELVEAFTAAGYFDLAGTSQRAADAVAALDRGDATVALVIPAGYAADLAAGNAQVQVLLDGTNSNVATVALGYAERIVASHAAEVAAGIPAGAVVPAAAMAPPPAPLTARPVELRDRAWFNPALESRNYNVPAVVGAILMLVCMLLTSLAVVREREIGTLEQLMVSPIRPLELIAGKTIPFALIGLLDLVLITLVAVFWFDVPFAGSPALLLLAGILFLLPALGVGLLISTVSKTQQEAFMASFLVFMPTILLSGFLFPVGSMPAAFRWLSLLNPLRHFLEIVRGIFLKGTGPAELWPQHLALATMGAVLLGLAAARFRKRTA